MAATTGTGSFSSRRIQPLVTSMPSKKAASVPGCTDTSILRSPPAKKVFFADVMTTPFRPSSPSRRSTVSARSGVKASFMALTGPSMSIVTVTMPSESLS